MSTTRSPKLPLAGLFGALAIVTLAPSCAATSTTPSIGSGASGTTASGSGTGGAASSSSTASGGGAGSTSSTATTSTTSATASSSSGGTGTFACVVKTAVLDTCTFYDDLTAAELEAQTAACAMELGTASTACASSDALGTCTVMVAGVTAVTTWYEGTATTALEAQTTCTSTGGTWTAG